MSGEGMTINFEEEIEHFKPSLEVEEVGEAIVKSDLTDMSDIMMELLKHMKGFNRGGRVSEKMPEPEQVSY